MASIEKEILEAFFKKLEASPEFDEQRIDQLRFLFTKKKKPPIQAISDVMSDTQDSETP